MQCIKILICPYNNCLVTLPVLTLQCHDYRQESTAWTLAIILIKTHLRFVMYMYLNESYLHDHEESECAIIILIQIIYLFGTKRVKIWGLIIYICKCILWRSSPFAYCLPKIATYVPVNTLGMHGGYKWMGQYCLSMLNTLMSNVYSTNLQSIANVCLWDIQVRL